MVVRRLFGKRNIPKSQAAVNFDPSPSPELADKIKKLVAEDDFLKSITTVEDTSDEPIHFDPVRLDPIVSREKLAPSKSWIGGNPSLPADVRWPEVDGIPCLFYAQIYCSELPDGTWGSFAPRDGWLLFFTASNDLGRTVVLHTKQLGTERTQRHKRGVFNINRMEMNKYIEVTKNEHLVMPKWPVRVSRIHLHDPANTDLSNVARHNHPDFRDNNRLRSYIEDCDLAKPEYHPIDWVSAKALLGFARGYLEKEVKRYTEYNKRQDYSALLSALEKVASEFLEKEKRLLKENAAQPFHDGISQRVIRLLSELYLEPSVATAQWRSSNGWGYSKPLSQSTDILREYAIFLEVHLRVLYTGGSKWIPDTHLAHLLEVWKGLAAFEACTMGGKAHEGYVEAQMKRSAFLLELPTSHLVGWTFGDVTSLGFFASPERLRRLDFSCSWGDVIN